MGEREITDTIVSEYEASLASHPKKPMRLSLSDYIEAALRAYGDQRVAEALEEAAEDLARHHVMEPRRLVKKGIGISASFVQGRAARLREGRG